MKHGQLAYQKHKCRCRVCRAWKSESNKRYYKPRPDRYKAVKQEIKELKNQPCADCGISYPPYVMDFDHVRGEKSFNVSLGWSKSREELLAEVAKCDVVCANCHRERTHRARIGHRKYVVL